MVKTKYVLALAGMRNSAGEAACVTAESRISAVVLSGNRQQCFGGYNLSSVFSSKIDTGVGNASGVVLVYR